ncbi:50S ribosomal protein L6 [Natronobacterium gregoryi]|uniref:Large ribosomal subunit protein uL6 n=2 Tax=Natronobacterium gregoryi TaxID=44930 RepID=L0AEJ5_NATGS|nr:50S ribosomal protein L6 [Natronobacterium gregoryi]AFZ71557.1 archaeal ribosomal protein L6P [Natronobacterium gregoryi SP2]ELY66614.1 50S ribosomal protein L6P [Natronobacterium gregoryi SP2]PLK21326.1 50S ribosomal protein L6 [Natronobacterium gregoryi SP2]SFI81785.1 LSU ribosomal protein L6P [Natronobacterium gregoryi]
MRVELEIPDSVTVEKDHLDVTVEGPEGSVTRRLWYPDVTVDVEDDTVVIESDAEDAKTNATVGTFESHVENAFHGVTEGWEYEMEVFYSHFPMQVRAEGDEVVIENFLGEKAPRRTTIHGDTEVTVDDEQLVLSGPDKEDVGQTAADIEQLTKVSGKDTRIFQDGVYITAKPAKGGV